MKHGMRQRLSEGIRWSTAPVRRTARLWAGRLQAGAAAPGDLISVIMPARQVETYIDAAIRSVLSQKAVAVELLIVDDGSTDGTMRRAEWWARRDRRVRVLHNDAPLGPNASRNRAIAEAEGRFLAFVDADDILLDGAYRDLLASMNETGSDFAVGCYDRLIGRRRTPAAPWIAAAHGQNLGTTTVRKHPQIMVNVVQWSKLYRREFWNTAELTFPVTGYYQDQIVAARAYVAAAAIDVLPRAVVSWRIRDDQSSMTQQYLTAPSINDRFATLAESVQIYGRSDPGLGATRLMQALANDTPIVARHAGVLDGVAWEALRNGLAVLSLLSAIPEELPEAPSEWRDIYLRIRDGHIDRSNMRVHR